MKKIGIVGHFNEMAFDGQTVKTRELYNAFQEKVGKKQIFTVSLSEFRKNPFKFFAECFKIMKICENIIILPAQNAIKILPPLFSINKKRYSYKLYYFVIGGWLPELLKVKKHLIKYFKNFNGIWVETSTMKNNLELLGLNNVFVVPNFKNLKIISEKELVFTKNPPYKLCTFSRVMKEKGIEDAINAVLEINEKVGYTKFELDIYGKIDSGYVDTFTNIQKSFPPYIKYCGIVEADKSVSVIKNYFALLFPTYYNGEGMPGTIIDAYSSGVPVIATNWRYNAEIVKHKKCGFIYDYKNKELLTKILSDIYETPALLNNMKKHCIKEAEKYTKESVMTLLEEYMKY